MKALQVCYFDNNVYISHVIVLKDASLSKEGEQRIFRFQMTAVKVSWRSVDCCDFYSLQFTGIYSTSVVKFSQEKGQSPFTKFVYGTEGKATTW